MSNADVFSQRWRAARACARCRRLKSRCVYETPAHASCQKCLALGIACSVDKDPTAQTAKRRPMMKLPARTRGQVLQKVQRLLAEAEREFIRLPRRKLVNENENGYGYGDGNQNQNNDMELELELEMEMELETVLAISELARRIQLQTDGLREKSGVANIKEPSKLEFADPLAVSGVDPQLLALEFVRSLVSEAEASARYTYFHRQMAVHFPVLMLPEAFQDFAVAMDACPLLVLTCVYVTTICDRGFSTRSRNSDLHARLGSYLDHMLARTIFVDAANLTHHLVFACMILSLWVVPPSRVHQYKSQIGLITAYSVSVCIDAGTVPAGMAAAVLEDDSVERNNLRCFLAVYCSCGSLNFSLPRFNFAAWSPRHEIAVDLLSQGRAGHVPLPSQSDSFLCFYLRVIHIGKDLSDLLIETGVSMNLLTAEQERGGLAGLACLDPRTHLFESLTEQLTVYETRLTETMAQSGVLDPNTHSNVPSGEKYCLLLTYYQLIMMIHDHLVSWCIHSLTTMPHAQLQDLDRSLVTKHVIKFGDACERILDCFVELNAGGVTGYPTFFYYRAMAALISLIRLLVLVKSDILQKYLPEVYCFKFRLPALYQEVLKIIEHSNVNYDLRVCEKFTDLLERIGRWVHVVQNNEQSRPATLTGEVDFLKLTNLSKGQEVEKFTAPRTLRNPIESSVRSEHSGAENSLSMAEILNFSIQEMFKGIDEDIIRFLNPFDSLDAGFSFTFD